MSMPRDSIIEEDDEDGTHGRNNNFNGTGNSGMGGGASSHKRHQTAPKGLEYDPKTGRRLRNFKNDTDQPEKQDSSKYGGTPVKSAKHAYAEDQLQGKPYGNQEPLVTPITPPAEGHGIHDNFDSNKTHPSDKFRKTNFEEKPHDEGKINNSTTRQRRGRGDRSVGSDKEGGGEHASN